jgi:hypothetical protein
MISKEEAYDIIFDINEEAHNVVWDMWIKADEEDDEELREEASEEQSIVFRELFYELDEETQYAIKHYSKVDESFRDDFDCWYGTIWL